MKVAIIGAQGMLGQELMNTFHEYKPIQWNHSDFDITDRKQSVQLVSNQKPGLVINASAFNDVDKAEGEEAIAMNINGYGPGYLASAVEAAGGILVHFSTDYVFNGNIVKGYREDDIPDPISIYGKSKLLGENEVRRKCHCHYIIRLSRLFGKNSRGRSGKKSFVELMLTLAQSKKELDIVDEELSSPTYAKDLADRTKYLIDNQLPFGTYHITNQGACTWFGFAQEIFTQSGISVKLNPVAGSFYPRAAKRPPYSVLLNTKLPHMRRWEEALKSYLLRP
ncbi:MAG: dTDP-4-dehydrorhamnose reductase [Patescibacteria group bacterium]